MTEDFERLMEQGRQHYALGRPDEAIAVLHAAASVAPDAARLRLVGRTHKRFGRFGLSIDMLRRAMLLEPDRAGDYLELALAQDFTEVNADVEAMLALDATVLEAADRAKLAFAIGKVLQDLGEIERSFTYYARANAEYRSTLTYDPIATAAEFHAIRQTFTAALFESFEGKAGSAQAPIFIVGLPRSGSTLTEQILATHKDAFGGGEMKLLPRLIGTIQERAGSIEAFLGRRPDLRPVADGYLEPILQALSVDGRGRTRFTDKLLGNFKHIGMIRLLFPNAKIVHCMRDPLDNLFTIFRRPFGGSSIPYSYDQEELAAFYRLYRGLMAHWRETLPGFVLDLSYEQMVAEPEPTMRRLLEFCGLDWDPACLEFHRTERGIATNSFAQVRQPLYASSIGMAEPYRPYIGPLVRAVEG